MRNIVLLVMFVVSHISFAPLAHAITCGAGADIGGGQCRVFLTSGTSWTVPSDWNSSSSTIEVIGGGGGGSSVSVNSLSAAGTGGGGGAYSKVTNVILSPGASVTYSIGTGGAGGAAGSGSVQAGGAGGDTYFCNSSSNCASISGSAVLAGAKGGAGGTTGASPLAGAAGGSSASGIGSTKYSGGTSGTKTPISGTGGGGAAGPSGNGAAGGATVAGFGSGGGGGGGNGGGSAGSANTTGGVGGGGGNNASSSGGGAGGTAGVSGGTGSSGGGGGGGAGTNNNTQTGSVGGVGGAGVEWDSTHGSGGGGGGGGGDSASNSGYKGGGAGGLYGGGGGGGGSNQSGAGAAAGSGAQGIIVITYAPMITSRNLNVTKAVSVKGNVTVAGSLSKGSGTFLIDHPLDPENKLLYHSFVESPDVLNVYDGIETLDGRGEAVVELPSYFEALNTQPQYFLSALDGAQPGLHIKERVKDNRFIIAGGTPGAAVSWQVTGIRHDPYILANPIIPEVEKGPDQLVDKGEYLFPEYYSYIDINVFQRAWRLFRSFF